MGFIENNISRYENDFTWKIIKDIAFGTKFKTKKNSFSFPFVKFSATNKNGGSKSQASKNS